MDMTSSPVELDQPLTPYGRLFSQPKMEQVINAVIAADCPMDISAIRSEIESSFLLNHPRFCSILVKNSENRLSWRKTKVNLDRHLIIHQDPLPGEDPVNNFLSDLAVSSPLPTDKPLWEFHLLMAHDVAVLRVHHALGDGISFMSFFLSCCRKLDDPSKAPDVGGLGARRMEVGTGNWLRVAWFTLVYVMEFVFRALWTRDETTVVSGGAGVEMWPRRMATARFRIDDMKIVKAAVAGATINDVLFGVISSGLSRYLEIRSFQDQTQAPREGLRVTGLAMVNLRPQTGLQDMSKLMNNKSGTRWGNKFGMIMLPVYYHKHNSDPVRFVKRAKAMIDKKKLSLEAFCTYKMGDLVTSLFGPKLASILNYRIFCSTTFSISSLMGPREKITFAGIPVKHIRATSSSLPHAIMMHMVSYNGYADMQILTAKEVVPDPEVLAKCLEDGLLEMKEAVQEAKKIM